MQGDNLLQRERIQGLIHQHWDRALLDDLEKSNWLTARGGQVEALLVSTDLVLQHPSPELINYFVLRLSNRLIANKHCSLLVKKVVCECFGRIKSVLSHVLNPELLISPVLHILASNDGIARIISLQTLSAISPVIAHDFHQVLYALQNSVRRSDGSWEEVNT